MLPTLEKLPITGRRQSGICWLVSGLCLSLNLAFVPGSLAETGKPAAQPVPGKPCPTCPGGKSAGTAGGAGLDLAPSPDPTLSGGTRQTLLQTGTGQTTLQTGTGQTTLQTGTGQTTLQTGTDQTTLQSGTDSTLIRARVERDGGPTHILILVDSSQSMKESIAGGFLDAMGLEGDTVNKMEAAKKVLEQTLARIPGDVNVGLRVFGQRFDNNAYSDCSATALLVPMGTHNRRTITEAVRTLRPYGLTPLAYALQAAERDLQGIMGNKTIILISDGAESCGGDPCEYIRAMSARGINVKIDIVGLGLKHDPEAKAQLDCITQSSGGKFYDANTAAELAESVRTSVKQAVSGKVIIKMPQQGGAAPAIPDIKP